jgi:hypothetical protein
MDYRIASTWPSATEGDQRDLPSFALRDAGGVLRVYPDHALATEPRASNSVLLPWFWWATGGTPEEVAHRLRSPPWLAVRPDVAPPTLRPEAARTLARTGRFNFLGRGFWPGVGDAEYTAVYDAGLANQILHAQELGRRDLALRLSQKLVTLAPSGFHTALLLESYRLLGQRGAAAEWLSQRPRSERSDPAINVVLALFERDAGNDASARTLLATSVSAFPGTRTGRSLTLPLSDWPPDFASMTSDPTLELRVDR